MKNNTVKSKSCSKKIALFSAVITLLGAAVTGCGGENTSSLSGGGSSSSSSTGSSSGGEASSDASSTDSANGPLISEPMTITYLYPENAYAPISQDCIALSTIKERTNVSLEFQLVPGSDYETKKSTYLATNKIPDVFYGSQSDIKTYARDGLFLNLSEYADQMPTYLGLINAPDRAEDSKNLYLDGNLYSFARLEQYRVGTAPQPMIRMDLLKKNNLPTPATWDELYDTFLKLKELYPDSYIMATRNGTNYLIGQIAFSLGSGGFEGFSSTEGMYYEPEEEKYLYGPIHENFKTALTFLHNMYQDGLLDPDYAVMTRDIAWEKLSSGRLLFYYDNDTFAARTFNPALQQIDPDAYFDMLDPMTNSYGQTRALRYQRDWFADNAVINADVERPEDVVRFFDWMYTDEGAMVTNFGAEGQSYYMENGEPQIMEELKTKHASSSDVLSSIQAEIGVGQFNFTPYINETWFKQTADPIMVEHGDRIDALTKSGEIYYMKNTMALAFTEEEAAQLTTLQTNVMTVFNTEIDKFITGARSLDEFDAFVQELVAQGAQTIEDVYNKAYQRIQ